MREQTRTATGKKSRGGRYVLGGGGSVNCWTKSSKGLLAGMGKEQRIKTVFKADGRFGGCVSLVFREDLPQP